MHDMNRYILTDPSDQLFSDQLFQQNSAVHVSQQLPCWSLCDLHDSTCTVQLQTAFHPSDVDLN